ncbi:hypothetical protein FJT64_026887 [Amphibalanus amphitrite]|uniref:Uncharacterized protein n=1 Tax=Amphibalanus amphitrite TaxID=1232801 RepID=A0A6A4WF49_AMPAM|nr:hypothetical protein FJT64_026887 [Amphibalanus amphitrite]
MFVTSRHSEYFGCEGAKSVFKRRRAALAGSDRAEYKEANRLCRAAIRRDCRAWYEREIRENSRGGLWRVLRPVIGRKQQQCDIPRITPNAWRHHSAEKTESSPCWSRCLRDHIIGWMAAARRPLQPVPALAWARRRGSPQR